MQRTLIIGVLSLTALGGISAEELRLLPQPLRVFPEADLEYQGDPSSSDVVWATLEPLQSWLRSGAPVSATRSASGSFSFHVVCPFYGDGEARIRASDDPSSPVVATIPISCRLPDERAASAPVASPLFAATTQAPSSASLTGLLDSYTFRTTSTGTRAKTFNGVTQENSVATTTDVTTYSPATRQLCTVRSSTYQCAGPQCSLVPPPPPTTVCTPATLGQTTDRLFFVDGNSVLHDIATAPRFDLNDRRESTYDSSLEVRWTFPALRPGDTIEGVTLVGRDVQISNPLGDFSIPPGGSPPVPIVVTGTAAFSPCPVPGIRAEAVEWSTGSAIGPIVLAPIASCARSVFTTFPGPPGTSNTRSESSLTSELRARFEARARVAATILQLAIAPESPQIAPRWEYPPDLNALGESSTPIRASLLGGEEGKTYTIQLEAGNFDATVGGHEHTGPPTRVITFTTSTGRTLTVHNWGEVNDNPGSNDAGAVPSGTCEITADTDGEGSCEFAYQSGPVAGRAEFKASVTLVDGTAPTGTPAEATSEVTVAVPNLGNTRALFPRTNELLVSSNQAHPEPFNASAGMMQAVQQLQQIWETTTHYLTTRVPGGPPTRAALPPTYLSFNDMSLPTGGVLDFSSTRRWRAPHAEHRKGTEVDINGPLRRSCSEGAPGCEPGAIAAEIALDDSNGLYRELNDACDAVGLTLLTQLQDPSSRHCEMP